MVLPATPAVGGVEEEILQLVKKLECGDEPDEDEQDRADQISILLGALARLAFRAGYRAARS